MNNNSDIERPKRRYRMTARADAAAATRERILDAAVAVFWERPLVDISLEEVARRAGVSLPTVIRHVRDRAGLIAAAGEREDERIRQQRDEGAGGGVRAAARGLGGHHEELRGAR